MKLQKQSTGKQGNKEYSKYVIVLPSKAIKSLEWKEGEELEYEIEGNKLIIKIK
ncbi:MAG: AbrB/MazE/SpoVT family DNA-binding domain-containing protein [Candidatus Nanoarchaeia archaeon]|jgi:antitoxin component of MazEF toxin-antitoxin module